MIRRFSSKSKNFKAREVHDGIELVWHTSLDLRFFKYMTIIDFQTSTWVINGKKLCHLSSNLTESSDSNPDGYIFSWFKKPQNLIKGLTLYGLNRIILFFQNIICLTGSSLTKLNLLQKI